jgi:hypothetical protein
MYDNWMSWIQEYQLPDDVKWSRINGKLITTISGYGVAAANYAYLTDSKDQLFKSVNLDGLTTKESVHKVIANVVLSIQVDLKNPKSYQNFRFNGKNHIVAP